MNLDINIDKASPLNIIFDNLDHNIDININAISRSSGVTPTGTLDINTNGEHIVYQYEKANVNVPTGPVKDESDITVSGSTVTVPAGLYSRKASKSVASGTAGTPTANKGTVANNQVSITPSVNNTTGYITGGTKTGTAVTVKASDLVSGTLNIDVNGEKDVTNYQKVNVNVQGGGGKGIFIDDSANKTTNKTSYTSTGISITIPKTGRYKFSWFHYAYAYSSSYYLTRLYRGTIAVGSTHASPVYSSGPEEVSETLDCTEGQTYTVYARTRSGSSYWTCVACLIAEEQ